MIIYHLIIFIILAQKYKLINKLTKLIVNLIGYNGKIVYDKSKPNGTLRKIHVKKINKIIKINNRDFEKDLKKTINHYKKLRKLQKIFCYDNNFSYYTNR